MLFHFKNPKRNKVVYEKLTKIFKPGNSHMNEILNKINALCPNEAFVIGYANLVGLLPAGYSNFSYGISIAMKLDDQIIDAISEYPTLAYLNHYTEINGALNECSVSIATLLTDYGIEAVPIKATLSEHEITEENRVKLAFPMSHKMIATRAGIGWIGKTDLLVTRRFGPRVRLASVLMNKEITNSGTPVDTSECGNCSVCVAACPAQAANGLSWNIGVERSQFYDAFKCRDYCRYITRTVMQKEVSICGKCVSVCPQGKLLSQKH